MKFSPTAMSILAASAVGAAGVTGYELSIGERILPGVVVAGVPVGGLTLEAATQKLEAAKLNAQAPMLTVRAGSDSSTVNARELGWRVDASLNAKSAHEIGRRGAWFKQVQDRLNALAGKIRLPLRSSVDASTVQLHLARIAKPFEVKASNARIERQGSKFVVIPDENGQGLGLESAVEAYTANPDLTELRLQTRPTQAEITAARLEPVVAQANALLRPIKLTYREPDREVRTPAPKKPVANNIVTKTSNTSGTPSGQTEQPKPAPTAVSDVVKVIPGRTSARTLTANEVVDLIAIQGETVEVQPKAISGLLDKLNQAFGEPAVDARYVRRNGGLEVKAGRNGHGIDLEAAQQLLRDEVLRAEALEVVLPVIATQSKIATLPQIKDLTLLAQATTTYYGSSYERQTNVAVAAAKLDGYTVPAGGEFNFNDAVGPIELENGFAEGLVISGGRTVKGVGGGVCQASTTTFRALYKAGLPVVERNQHAYRVHWYDPIVGMDAAVYQPVLNMRMTNDTNGPLVVRATTQPGRMTVQVYGLPQDRDVIVSSPVILSRTPHPPPVYEYTRALRPGAQKQVDWAVDGYRVRVIRTIKDKQGSRSDTLFSVYRPWRAVYQVGAGAPGTAQALARR